jgi:hypothetical protein
MRSRSLLVGGVILGPLFYLVVAIQIWTRTGFDIRRHPLSLLSLGEGGWVQTANFIITGLLALGCALGMPSQLRGKSGGTWGPLLVGTYGLGMVAAGVFPADPSLGFPPGAPEGVPESISRSGKLHGVGFLLAFGSLIAACFVFARLFHRAGLPGWTWYCSATGAVMPAIICAGVLIPSATSFLFALAGIVGFGWVSAVAARLLSAPMVVRPAATSPARG